MKKKAVLLFLLMMIIAGCAKVPEQKLIEEVNVQKFEKEQQETDTEVSELVGEKQPTILTEEKKQLIEDCLTNGNFVYEPILMEEMISYLDEKGISFEGYYDTNVRIDMTLEDGTYLVFLRTQNSDMEDTGYQLMLKDTSFNASGFQENYTNAYDVNTDQYYEPDLSERLWTEEELAGRNKLDLAIARNQLFAKYGRCFSDPLFQNIFAVKSWYEPKYSAEEFDLMSQKLLTEMERENLKMITQYEKLRGYRKVAEPGIKEVKSFVSGSWIDLDGDGKKEKLIYKTEGIGEETAFYSYPEKVTLMINDTQLVHDGCNTQGRGHLLTMDNVHYYIVIGDDGPSADYVSTFYEYKNGVLKQVGQMYAHPESLIVYEDKILAPEETYHFQCQPVKFCYELIDGMFIKLEEDYCEYRGNTATAQREVQLYSEKEGTEIGITIEKGEEVQIMGGDRKEWVLLKKVSTGEEGWIRTENYHNCVLISGETVYSGELFEGLYFYG